MALLELIKQTTPPGIIINGPPTPPLTADANAKSSRRVATILRVFKDCKNGRPPKVPWTVYKLNSEEYQDLQHQLKDDSELWGYVDDTVRSVIDSFDGSWILTVIHRYDYDPIGSKLIIRMSTTLHDTFASKLVTEIKKRLESLAKNQIQTRDFIKKISSVSGAIHFEEEGKKFKHVPDIRFHHEDAAWPGVVIEVSYSQKRKGLVDLAENYILASDGGIRVVVGIDLEYKKSKEASISIWRLKISPGDDGQPKGEVIQELDNEVNMLLNGC